MITGPEVKTASSKKEQVQTPMANLSSRGQSGTGTTYQQQLQRPTPLRDSELP